MALINGTQDADTKALIAGYGKYYRIENDKDLCQTDQYGRNKFHMCAAAGDGDRVCNKDPAPVSSDCVKFFGTMNKTLPEANYEEIKIVDAETKKEAFCYPTKSPEPKSSGWCVTDTNYYFFKPKKEKGWGFCGRDCYLGKFNKKKESGVLRLIDSVDVLSDNLCNVFLKEASDGIHLKVKPKILCVGEFRPWRTQLWEKKGQRPLNKHF